jgi:hypothetical protein
VAPEGTPIADIGTKVQSYDNAFDDPGVNKTSAIATLFYGLRDAMQKKIKLSNAEGTLRANAMETKVKSLPKAGWRFSGHTDIDEDDISVSPSSAKSRLSPPIEWR